MRRRSHRRSGPGTGVVATALGLSLVAAGAALPVGCGGPPAPAQDEAAAVAGRAPGGETPAASGESSPAAGRAGCAAPSAGESAGSAGSVATTAGGSADAAAAGDPRPRVVFLGDSLTAGYGLAEEQAFPALVGELLAAEGRPIQVVNAGVSGDTSAGGLARLDWLLRQRPDVVVVELGPNDGLRGLPLAMTEANLRAIVERARAAGARVLLVGMQLPPNYGPDYAGAFRDLYPRLARDLGVPLVPFLLAGVGGEPDLNLPDGLHPNAEGHRVVAGTVLPHLRDLLAALHKPAAARGK